MRDAARDRYWAEVEVPYTWYAYQEVLAVFGDHPGRPGSMLASFERIAAHLSDGAVNRMEAIDEAARVAALEQYEGVSSPGTSKPVAPVFQTEAPPPPAGAVVQSSQVDLREPHLLTPPVRRYLERQGLLLLMAAAYQWAAWSPSSFANLLVTQSSGGLRESSAVPSSPRSSYCSRRGS